MSDKRIIHTGIFSENAAYVIKALFSYIDDNESRRMGRNATSVSVVVNPDGEVVLEHTPNYWSKTIWDRNRGNDSKPKQWLAIMLKKHVISECGSDGVWRRNNDARLVETLDWHDRAKDRSFTPTVSEVYCIYDALMSRKNIERKFPKEVVAKICGERRDPISTEMEIAKREEIARLRSDCESAIRKIESDTYEAVREYEKKLQDEAAAKKLELRKKLEADLKNIEELSSSGFAGMNLMDCMS